MQIYNGELEVRKVELPTSLAASQQKEMEALESRASSFHERKISALCKAIEGNDCVAVYNMVLEARASYIDWQSIPENQWNILTSCIRAVKETPHFAAADIAKNHPLYLHHVQK